MMQTSLFAVVMAFGAELLLMTALLLSRSSSQRWLLTRDLTRNSVMEPTAEMEVAAMFQTSLFAVLTLITTQIGVQLPLMTALLLSGSSSQRWLLTRMPGRRRDLPRNSVMEATVEMDTAAMMQTTLFVVLVTTFGVELLLMTALLLSRSSSQWLLTRDLPRKIVMVQIVETDGVAMKVTTHGAAH